MGFFATLHAPLRCPFCDEGTLDRAQFHVGELGDLPDYKLGQRVAGEKRSCIAVGYPEACSACSKDALVSIVIDAGTLRSVHFRSSFPWDPDTVLIGPERIGDDGSCATACPLT